MLITIAFSISRLPFYLCTSSLSLFVLLAYWEKRERGLCSLGLCIVRIVVQSVVQSVVVVQSVTSALRCIRGMHPGG